MWAPPSRRVRSWRVRSWRVPSWREPSWRVPSRTTSNSPSGPRAVSPTTTVASADWTTSSAPSSGPARCRRWGPRVRAARAAAGSWAPAAATRRRWARRAWPARRSRSAPPPTGRRTAGRTRVPRRRSTGSGAVRPPTATTGCSPARCPPRRSTPRRRPGEGSPPDACRRRRRRRRADRSSCRSPGSFGPAVVESPAGPWHPRDRCSSLLILNRTDWRVHGNRHGFRRESSPATPRSRTAPPSYPVPATGHPLRPG